MLTKKLRFLARAPPSKIVYIGAQGAFRKFLGSVTKNGFFKIVQSGDTPPPKKKQNPPLDRCDPKQKIFHESMVLLDTKHC